MAKIYLQVDEDVSVGVEAFSRIASAVPIVANVVISENLFAVLTKTTGSRLQFAIYDKYLSGLERLFHVDTCLQLFSHLSIFLQNPFSLLIFLCLEIFFSFLEV